MKGSTMERPTRRTLLRQGSVLALLASCGVLTLREALAAEVSGFEAKTLAEALKALGEKPADSADIVITSPDIAENGAVVPFTISSKLPKTEQLALLVEKNPNILAASFNIPDGTEPSVNTRVKMGQTSNVIALVKADGKFYYTTKEVKVTLGGCGG
jgi:sulfur-oxidizing protein SoxY